MRIDFYYTAKRINSLVRPDTDETQTIVTTFTDFNLKDETSLNNPVFIVVASNLPETNYCILSGTGATAERPDKYYYFVNSITQVRKTVWSVSCTIDALATWRDTIKQQSAFVERSTSHYKPYVIDSLLPTLNEQTQRTIYAKINADMQSAQRGGTYILSLASTGHNVADGGTTGGVNVYAMSQDNCLATLETLYGAGSQIKQMFNSVSECILGLHWLPIGLYAIGGKSISTIFVGGVSVNISAHLLTSNIYDTGLIMSENVSLTHYGDFRDNAPYRNYHAKVPYGGIFDLDCDLIAWRNRVNNGAVTINARQMLDYYTGAIKTLLYCDNFVVGSVEGNCRVDIPISCYKANTAGLVGSAANKYGETVNAIFDFLGIGQKGSDGWTGSAADNVADWLSTGGSYSIIGGYNGTNIGAYDPELRIFERLQNTSVEPSNVGALNGRPYCGVLPLSSLTGYCKTQGFNVRGRMSAEEKTAIENAFNISGVFMTE